MLSLCTNCSRQDQVPCKKATLLHLSCTWPTCMHICAVQLLLPSTYCLVGDGKRHWASFGASTLRCASKQRNCCVPCVRRLVQDRRVRPSCLGNVSRGVLLAEITSQPVRVCGYWLPYGVGDQDIAAHVKKVLRPAKRQEQILSFKLRMLLPMYRRYCGQQTNAETRTSGFKLRTLWHV